MTKYQIVNKILNMIKVLNAPDKDSMFLFYPYQKRLARRIISMIIFNWNETIIAEFARQSGKTETGKAVIHALMILLPMIGKKYGHKQNLRHLKKYKSGFKVGFVGPTFNQASIPFKRQKEFLARGKYGRILLEDGMKIKVEAANEKTIRLSNGSRAIAMSASPTASESGWDFHLIWYDESQGIAEEMKDQVFDPMLTAWHGKSVKSGTPGRFKGWFHDEIMALKRLDKKHSKNYFHVDYKEASNANNFYFSYIRNKIWELDNRYGRDKGIESIPFQINYALKWLLKEGQFMTVKEFASIVGEHKRYGETQNSIKIGGLDIAKQSDSTVAVKGDFTNRHGDYKIQVRDILEIEGIKKSGAKTTYMDTQRVLQEYFRDCDIVSVDSTGGGEIIADYLDENLLDTKIVRFVFTPKGKDQLYRNFENRCQTEQFKLYKPEYYDPLTGMSDDQEFTRARFQLTNLECEIIQRKLMNVHHPDKEGALDDIPDALALINNSAEEWLNHQLDSIDYEM